MANIGLIINEKSDRSPALMSDLMYIVRGFKNVYAEVLDGVLGLDKALSRMNNHHVETLVLAGGDGTMQAAFTDSINNQRFTHEPHFVALPCGMTNVIANDCGLQGPPIASLDNFLWRCKNGGVSPLRRPLLSITAGGRAPVHGCFFGAGAFHSAVKYSRSRIQSKGVRRSAALVLSVGSYILKAALDPVETRDALNIDIDAEDDADNFLNGNPQMMMLATTLNKLGSGIFPFWGGGTGAIATMTIDYSATRLLWAAPFILRSRQRPWFEEYGYRSWRSDKMAAEFEAPFVFDGEVYMADRRHKTIFQTSRYADFLT